MEIAGKLTIKDWDELKLCLDENYDENWGLAFHFFEERIRTRYLNPIKAILDLDLNEGEGFAVVNLQCSLVETIESFINGWVYDNYKWVKDGVIVINSVIGIVEKPTKSINNEGVFFSFFEKRMLSEDYNIDGIDFFKSVRCGLLHETQTKNNWLIRKGKMGGIAFEKDDKGFKIIYRDNFQKAIEALIKNYKLAIINGKGKEFDEFGEGDLRKNFIAKFNHICCKSKL
jgi:hypothetical protein